MSAIRLSSETPRAGAICGPTASAARTIAGPEGAVAVNGEDASSAGKAGAVKRQQAFDIEPSAGKARAQQGETHSAALALPMAKTHRPMVICETRAAMASNFLIR